VTATAIPQIEQQIAVVENALSLLLGRPPAQVGRERLADAEAQVNGRVVDVAVSEHAGGAASASVNPQSDIHASGAYRKSLVGTMVERALQSAAGLPCR